ncbi:Alpha/Beta hydrolase protein [Aspergillus crustosus]
MPPFKSYPPPLVIDPLSSDQHTHTIILLHGRGSNSDRFGHVFLESTGIAKRLPTSKFIFPTASKRRSTVLKRVPINQWFDNYSLDDPNTRTELQLDGLQETSGFIRKLIHEEAEILSKKLGVDQAHDRIVIGGLSQGCAASIFCLLGGFSNENKPLAGFVGMSGWLPLESEVSALFGDDDEEEEEDDMFARNEGDDNHDDTPLSVQAVNHVRDVLDLPSVQSDISHLKTPVFLGHGSEDPKVSVELGRRLASILSDGFEMDVTWKAYDEFGHWYKVPDEIDDILQFLKAKTTVPVAEL